MIIKIALSFKVILFVAGLVLAASPSYSHEGEDHGPQGEAGNIKDGKLEGKDGVVYLDAGKSIFVGPLELRQRISEENQILYQSNYEDPNLNGKTVEEKLALEAPGGEKLKAFKTKSMAEKPEPLQVLSPTLSTDVEISKSKELKIEWYAPENTNSQMQIIVEVVDSEKSQRTVIGRMIIDAKDDGLFIITPEMMANLPTGKAELAIKRLQFSSFQRKGSESLIAVKGVDAKVAKARVTE